MKFEGKQALVTGAGSGIGAAVTAGLVANGATVIAADLNLESLESLWKNEPNVRISQLDVTSEAQWAALFTSIAKLDLFVASAGISHASPLENTSLEDWRRVMSVNLDGAFLGVRYSIGVMRKAQKGSIVLIGSASGTKAASGACAYCASKAALRMFAKVAALECKADGIRINTVSPAGVATPMWKSMAFWDDLVKQHGNEEAAWNALGGIDPSKPALQRMAFPEEIARAILFLCSEDSAGVTATDLAVDGGYTA